MKKSSLAMVLAAVLIQAGVASASEAWHAGAMGLVINDDGSAKIQEICGSITIADWNDDGETMTGQSWPGVVMANPRPTRVKLVANRESDNEIQVSFGDGDAITFTRGRGLQGAACL